MPLIATHFDSGTFPLQLLPRMAETGLFGLHVDGYGCKKASHLIYGLICQELGRCDSGLRAMFSVQNSLAMFPIYAFGSEEQKMRWLPKMARGEVIESFRNENQSLEAEKSLPPERSQDVDHQWVDCSGGLGLGKNG
jgi:glutaryl-CoA dehydrogenase